MDRLRLNGWQRRRLRRQLREALTSASTDGPWRSWNSTEADRPVKSHARSVWRPGPSTTGPRRPSVTTTPPLLAMPNVRAVPAGGPNASSDPCWRPWVGRLRNSGITPWTGRFLCSRSISAPTATRRSRTIRSDAGSGSSATSGGGPGTSWTLIPSWRKKRQIRRRLRRLPPRSVVLAEDETDLLLFPPLRAGWAPRGEPKEVLLSGWNARRVVFGSLNLRTGTRLFLARQRQRAGDFQAFLEYLHWHDRGWHVALLVDEDPSHTAVGSQRAAQRSGTALIWLPKRAPKLNPMDHLWGHGNDEVSANRQYESIDDHVDRFVGYLNSLRPDETLTKAGVLSEEFWLKTVL